MRQFNKFRGTKGFITMWERVLRFRYMITEQAKERCRILAYWEKYGDDVTSSLDASTERMVFDRLVREMDDRLIVCATHKLQILDRFNVVVVFDGGRVVGMGTPAELLENCPAYKRLVESPEVS